MTSGQWYTRKQASVREELRIHTADHPKDVSLFKIRKQRNYRIAPNHKYVCSFLPDSVAPSKSVMPRRPFKRSLSLYQSYQALGKQLQCRTSELLECSSTFQLPRQKNIFCFALHLWFLNALKQIGKKIVRLNESHWGKKRFGRNMFTLPNNTVVMYKNVGNWDVLCYCYKIAVICRKTKHALLYSRDDALRAWNNRRTWDFHIITKKILNPKHLRTLKFTWNAYFVPTYKI